VLEDLVTSGVACRLVREEGVELVLLLERHEYMQQSFVPRAPPGVLDSLVYVLRRCGVRVLEGLHYTD
jgi:hypothetical protein